MDEDLKNLPAIIFTSDVDWDPTIYDSCPDELVTEEFEIGLYSDNFTSKVNCKISIFESAWDYETFDLGDFYQFDDPNLHSCIRYAHLHAQDKLSQGPMVNMYKPHKILPSNPDFEKLRPNFGWLPAETVKNTI